MNYGYSNSDFHPLLSLEDENERYPIQLYHYLASKLSVENLDVVEVGSGRGGGASYIAKKFNPKSICGIDISSTAIDLCNKLYNQNNLSFLTGDSENLPFSDNSIDIVFNVESSHCYPSMFNFVDEVSRVLKPGGYFVYCDLLLAKDFDEHIQKLSNNKIDLISFTDISSNVIEASELMTESRKKLINNSSSGLLKKVLFSFASVKGSKIFKSFQEGHYKYISALCKKVI